MGYVTGYVCGSCPEHPVGAGPWLLKVSQDPAPAPAPYIPQYRVPVSRVVALPGSPRIGRWPWGPGPAMSSVLLDPWRRPIG